MDATMDKSSTPVASAPITAPAMHSPEFRQNVAVVIGINHYSNGIAPLTTPTHDAERLATILQTDHHYTVHLLTTEVTRQRLADLFQAHLPTELGADDRLLVYFAGHGIALDGDDGPTGYLIPQDGVVDDRRSFLAMTELQSWLHGLPCRHLLLILDCCFAGAFRWASMRNLTLVPEVIHQERYDRFIQSPAWQVLTSAAYDQTALDLLAGDVKRGVAANTENCHSPFAYALFQALAGASDLAPQGRGDGVITATELYLYLRDAVEVRADQEANHQQTPGLWPLKKHRKGEFIFLAPGHILNLPPAPDLTEQTNPYRGLKPYEQRHANLFFGRDQQIAELAAVVTAQPLTVVLGASGTGKSSLVKAGLLPALQAKVAPPVALGWRVLAPMRPGDTPLRTLEHLLHTTVGDPTMSTAPTAEAPILAPLVLLSQWLAAHPAQRLLLVVDQFEELITQCRDDAERRQFQELLATLLAAHPQQLRVVLTLRSDFEPQFSDSPLVTYWPAGRYIVPPLTQADLRAVIEGPAAACVLYFEPPELVDRLIDEVIQTPGALPLLSFTLSEMYMTYVKSASDNRALTFAHYEALGGVIGSLRIRATQEYRQLPDDAHRSTMRRVMLRMVSVEGGELARRRVPLFELQYPTAAENERVTTVIDRLVEARLLVRDSSDLDEDGTADSYVEPAHDALVRAWDQLLGWQREAALYLPLQRRLTPAARAWKNATETDKAGLLWNNDPGLPQVMPKILRQVDTLDGLLEPMQALWPSLQATALPDWLNEVETVFIQQSVRRRALLRRRVVSLALAVMLALSVTAIVALVQRQSALEQRNNFASTALAANAQLAIQNGDYDLAIALALQANQIDDPPPLAQNTLAAAAYVPGTELYYKVHTKDVTGVALSPSGRYAVSASLDGSAVIQDLQAHTITHRLGASQIVSVTALAYSPTQEQVLLGLGNGELVVWDVVSGAVRQRLPITTQAITALTYNSTGQQALVGDKTGALTLWDLTKGTQLLHLVGHTAAIRAVAISVDGTSALSGGDAARPDVEDAPLFLWDLTTGKRRQTFAGHQEPVTLVAYGPLPGYVISGSQDRNVVAWQIATGEAKGGFPIDAHTQGIGSIAVAPGYATVASGGWDGSILLWGNPARGGLIRTFVGHRAPVIALAYSHDGQRLLSGSKDGVVRLWDISGPAQVRRLMLEPILSGHAIDPVHNLAVDVERQRGLSGTINDAILWDLKTGNEIKRFPASPRWLSSVALSPDGQSALIGADGDLHWWDLTTGVEKAALRGHTRQLITIRYRADSQMAWSADKAGLVIGWDLTQGQQKWSCKLAAPALWSIALSPDGSFALTGAEDATVSFWELPTCQLIRRFVGHQDAVYWVALSPDQTTALTGSADRSIILWDLATGQPIRHFAGHTLPVHTVAYSPDGQTILSASEDKTIRLWDMQTGAERFRFEGHPTTVQNLLYLPGTNHILSRAKDGSLIEWQLPLANRADLLTWTYAHRYVRALTCDERLLYNLEPCP